MDATITAATIAAASTGGIAVLGFIVNAWTTTRTLATSRHIAQDERMWAKQAAIYEEILADANRQQLGTEHDLRDFRYTDEIEQKLQDARASWIRPDFPTYLARSYAYATDAVNKAQSAFDKADRELWKVASERARDAAGARANPAPTDVSTMQQLNTTVQDRRRARDEALAELIVTVRAALGHTIPPPHRRWLRIPARPR